MSTRHRRRHCELAPASRKLLLNAIERLGLSARVHDRILEIESEHVAEAVQYRALDRAYFR